MLAEALALMIFGEAQQRDHASVWLAADQSNVPGAEIAPLLGWVRLAMVDGSQC